MVNWLQMPSYKKKIPIPGKKSEDIYAIVSKEISAFLTKLGVGEFKLSKSDAQKTLEMESKLFSAKLHCRDEEVELDGSLSFLAVPFKSKIDEGISRWISKHFNV